MKTYNSFINFLCSLMAICRNYSLTEIKERLDYSGFEGGQNQA